MKILMTGFLPPDPNLIKGGVISVIRILLESFRGIPGLEVCHLSFNREVDVMKMERYTPNIKFIFIPYKSNFDLIDYLLNRKILNSIIEQEQPDLIHIQEITPQLLRFLHLDRTKIVVTQHGIMKQELKYADSLSSKLKGYFKALVERFIFPLFPNVIFISKYNRKLFYGKPNHQEIILNPINRNFFSGNQPPGDPNSLLMVAAFCERKNPELILSALAELKKYNAFCRLHLAGGFKNKRYESFIHRRVIALGLSDQIIFHGWCSPKKIQELMYQCAVFILPSRQETLPVVIGEAMATGRAILAADVGAVSEMFTDGKSGLLFPDNDKEALVAALKMILFDPSFRIRLSKNAISEAQEKFHPDHIAAKTIRFYERINQKQAFSVNA